MPEQTRPCRPYGSVDDEPQTNTPLSRLLRTIPQRTLEILAQRYRGLPSWVLLAQVFLAAGWLRAVAAHGMDSAWWNGEAIDGFRSEYQELSIEWYRATIMDGPIQWWPAAVGIVVFVAQLVVALMLAFNFRPIWGLALGATINVNLVLAGATNPSVFYLIIGAVLALWHIDASVHSLSARKLTTASTLFGALALGALLPEIATVDPAHVIEDPAIVLSFLAVLWVGALRIETIGVVAPDQRSKRRGPGGKALVGAVPRPAGGGYPPVGSRNLTCERSQ